MLCCEGRGCHHYAVVCHHNYVEMCVSVWVSGGCTVARTQPGRQHWCTCQEEYTGHQLPSETQQHACSPKQGRTPTLHTWEQCAGKKEKNTGDTGPYKNNIYGTTQCCHRHCLLRCNRKQITLARCVIGWDVFRRCYKGRNTAPTCNNMGGKPVNL